MYALFGQIIGLFRSRVKHQKLRIAEAEQHQIRAVQVADAAAYMRAKQQNKGDPQEGCPHEQRKRQKDRREDDERRERRDQARLAVDENVRNAAVRDGERDPERQLAARQQLVCSAVHELVQNDVQDQTAEEDRVKQEKLAASDQEQFAESDDQNKRQQNEEKDQKSGEVHQNDGLSILRVDLANRFVSFGQFGFKMLHTAPFRENGGGSPPRSLYVEEEFHDVAVLHDVFLALGTDEALFLAGRDRAVLDERFVRHDGGADEAALEIAVDLAGGLRRLGALLDRPCADLLGSCGQEADEPQKPVARLDELIETGFVHAHFFKKRLLFVRIELRDLFLKLRADGHRLRALVLCDLVERLHIAVRLAAEVVLADVRHVDDGLRGEKEQPSDRLLLVLVRFKRADRFAALEVRVDAFQKIDLDEQLLVTALRHLLLAVDALFDGLHVREDQLKVDRLRVAGGVYAAVHVHDVVVVKAAHDVHHGVDLADVRQELVAESLAAGRAAHQSRDIDKLDDRRRVFLGMMHLREHVQPVIRHGNDADVRLDRAERIVRRLRARAGDGVEQRGLADVRQSDDTQLHIRSSSRKLL